MHAADTLVVLAMAVLPMLPNGVIDRVEVTRLARCDDAYRASITIAPDGDQTVVLVRCRVSIPHTAEILR